MGEWGRGGAIPRAGERMLLEHFLATAPNWLIFACFLAVISACGLAFGYAVHRVVRATGVEIDQRTRDYGQIVYLGVFALTALVMTFSTVEVRASAAKAATTVREEGRTLVHLDRLLIRYGKDRTAEARALIAEYAKAVVEEDWPLMRAGKDDGAARVYDILARLEDDIAALPRGGPVEAGLVDRMLEDMGDLGQQHDDRIIAAAEARLPSVFWWLIGALTAAVCVLAGTLAVRPFGLYFLGVKLTAIALMVSFLAVQDAPFRGETSVSAQPILYAIEYLSAKPE